MTALPSAETPRATTQPPKRRDKAVQRSARPAARAPTKTKVQAKAARAKAAPSPARRAEDLFSRN